MIRSGYLVPVKMQAFRVFARALARPSASNVRLSHSDLFKPYEQMQKYLKEIQVLPKGTSMGRMHYDPECEAAVNKQINAELSLSYAYLAMASYFSRDYIALKGVATHFKAASEEERTHGQKLIDFQHMRGGTVTLQTILQPETEYGHPDKSAPLHALEIALALEKMNYDNLLEIYNTANKHNDVLLLGCMEELLKDQGQDVKKASDLVGLFRLLGTSNSGILHFDHKLEKEYSSS